MRPREAEDLKMEALAAGATALLAVWAVVFALVRLGRLDSIYDLFDIIPPLIAAYYIREYRRLRGSVQRTR